MNNFVSKEVSLSDTKNDIWKSQTNTEFEQALAHISGKNKTSNDKDSHPDTQSTNQASNTQKADFFALLDQSTAELTSLLTQPDSAQSTAEQLLMDKDPVTHAFVRSLNVNIDPEQPGLSKPEKALAQQNTATFALLRNFDIKIDVNEVGAPVVTMNGETVELSDKQKQDFKHGNISAFGDSLLRNIELDTGTRSQIAALAAVRMEHTKAEVDKLLASDKPSEALTVLKSNMDGALHSMAREAVWQYAGTPFNEKFFKDTLQGIMSGEDKEKALDAMGNWLQDNAKNMPPEVARIALDATMDVIDANKDQLNKAWASGMVSAPFSFGGQLGSPHTTHVNNLGQDNSPGEGIYKGLSALVQQAPDRAEDVTSWLLGDKNGGSALKQRIRAYDYRAITSTAEDGFGLTLSNTLHNAMNYGEFEEQLSSAAQSFSSSNNNEIYQSFEADKIKLLSAHFDGLLMDPQISEPARITSDIELRNTIGRAMGYIPDNDTAAMANDYNTDWYLPGTDERKRIDLITGWIKQETGTEFKTSGEVIELKTTPLVYSSPRDGVEKFAGFTITDKAGNTHYIDGSAAGRIIAMNGGENVSPDQAAELGWRYDSFSNFIDENVHLDPDAQLYLPKERQLRLQDKGVIGNLAVETASRETATEKALYYTDIGTGIVASTAAIVATWGRAAPLVQMLAQGATIAGMGYGFARSADSLVDMSSHNQTINPIESQAARGAWLNIAGTTFAGLSAGAGLAAGSSAFATSSAAGKLNLLSRGAGLTGAAIGIEQTAEQGHMLATQWENMNPLDISMAIMDIGTAGADIAVGAWANRTQNGQQSPQNVNTGHQIDSSLPLAAREFAERALPEGVRVEVRDSIPLDGQALYSLPGFESGAVTAIQDADVEKATPDQWMARLRKAGVSKNELDWTGVEKWLNKQPGKSIAKDDVVAYLQDNMFDLDETIRFHNPKDEVPVNVEDISEQFELTEEEIGNDIEEAYHYHVEGIGDYRVELTDGLYHIFLHEGGISKDTSDYLGTGNVIDNVHSLQEAQHVIHGHAKRRLNPEEKPQTQFNEFQVPGGTNYGELLIRFPQLEKVYVSKHYENQELLHVRFDEREITGPDGDTKKVLFIQEMQSDFHQGSRSKRHYDGSGDSPIFRDQQDFYQTGQEYHKLCANDPVFARETKLLARELSGFMGFKKEAAIRNEVADSLAQGQSHEPTDAEIKVVTDLLVNEKTSVGSFFDSGLDDDTFDATYDAIGGDRIEEIIDQVSNTSAFRDFAQKFPKEQDSDVHAKLTTKLLHYAVAETTGFKDSDRLPWPPAPYQNNHWQQLGLKRMIKYAADNGFDAIAWSTADQIGEAVGATPGQRMEVLYDSRLGQTLDRYTKKWGGKVELTPEGQGLVPGSDQQNQILYLTPEMKAITTQKLSIDDGAPDGSYDPVNNIITVARTAVDPTAVVRHETIHALKDIGVFTDEEWTTLTEAAYQEGWIDQYGIREKYEEFYGKVRSDIEDGRHVDQIEDLDGESPGVRRPGSLSEEFESLYRDEGSESDFGAISEWYDGDGPKDISDAEIEKLIVEEAVAHHFAQWADGEIEVSPGLQRIFQKIVDFINNLKMKLRSEGVEKLADVDKIYRMIESGDFAARAQGELAPVSLQRAFSSALSGAGEPLHNPTLAAMDIGQSIQDGVDNIGPWADIYSSMSEFDNTYIDKPTLYNRWSAIMQAKPGVNIDSNILLHLHEEIMTAIEQGKISQPYPSSEKFIAIGEAIGAIKVNELQHNSPFKSAKSMEIKMTDAQRLDATFRDAFGKGVLEFLEAYSLH